MSHDFIKYDKELYKSYINKCVMNMLSLKYSVNVCVPVEIIYEIIDIYWNFRCRPVFIIYSWSKPLTCLDGIYSRENIIDSINQICLKSHYCIKIISNNDGLNNYLPSNISLSADSYFHHMFHFHDITAFLIPGFKWNNVVKTGIFNHLGHFRFELPVTKYFTIGELAQHILSWIINTFENNNFLTEQNIL